MYIYIYICSSAQCPRPPPFPNGMVRMFARVDGDAIHQKPMKTYEKSMILSRKCGTE